MLVLICIMHQTFTPLSYLVITLHNYYYDVIRYDIMANNEHLKPIDCLSTPRKSKACGNLPIKAALSPYHKPESIIPTIVCPKLTQQWVFEIQVVKYFMFFAAYVQ